jgi:hypothetical protein
MCLATFPIKTQIHKILRMNASRKRMYNTKLLRRPVSGRPGDEIKTCLRRSNPTK